MLISIQRETVDAQKSVHECTESSELFFSDVVQESSNSKKHHVFDFSCTSKSGSFGGEARLGHDVSPFIEKVSSVDTGKQLCSSVEASTESNRSNTCAEETIFTDNLPIAVESCDARVGALTPLEISEPDLGWDWCASDLSSNGIDEDCTLFHDLLISLGPLQTI